jgi:hypothetical protein
MTSVITALFAIMAETAKSTSQPARQISDELNALPDATNVIVFSLYSFQYGMPRVVPKRIISRVF